MYKVLFALAFALLLTWPAAEQASAQSRVALRGQVTDTAGKGVEGVTVSLLHLPDSIRVQKTTGPKGAFVLNTAPGAVQLTISHVGFEPFFFDFTIEKKDTLSLGRLVLQPRSAMLAGVSIQAQTPPVVVRHDTLTYNAASYPTPPNATLEELLKRLPGVSVDNNGKITMQGHPVTKIYIDGKEFFLGDPHMATQALTADMVSKLDLFDLKSEKSKRTGIRDFNNNNKAINIRLKPSMRRSVNGMAYAGAGSEGRYAAGARALMFNKEEFADGEAGINNTNDLRPGGEHFAQNLGNGSQQIGNERLNFRTEAGKKFTPVFNYNGSQRDVQPSFSSDRQTFFSDSATRQKNSSLSHNDQNSQSLRGELSWATDSLGKLSYIPSFTFNHGVSSSAGTYATAVSKPGSDAYTLNSGSSSNTDRSDQYDLENGINYNTGFKKKGRFLTAGLRLHSSSTAVTGGISSLTDLYRSDGSRLSVVRVDEQYRQKRTAGDWSGNFSFAEPLTERDALEIGYQQSASRSTDSKQSFSRDSLTGRYDQRDSLSSNNFVYRQSSQRANLGVNISRKQFGYHLGLGAEHNLLENDDLSRGTSISHDALNWYPSASVHYEFAREQSLSLNYNGSTNQPTISQLQPVNDLSHPLFVLEGNPGLKPEFVHQANAEFRHADPDKMKTLFLTVNGTVTERKMVPSTSYGQGGIQTMRWENAGGTWNLGGSAVYAFPLGSMKRNTGELSGRLNYTNEPADINGRLNVRKGLVVSESARVNLAARDKFFINASAELNYTSSSYSLQGTPAVSGFNQSYTLTGTWLLPWLCNINLACNRNVTGAQGGLPAREVNMVNASLYRNLFPDKRTELRLSGYNLLNSSENTGQTANENYIETRQSNVLNRFVLLSIIYHFRVILTKGNS